LEKKKWYNLEINEIFKILDSQKTGLSNEYIKERINEFGLNELKEDNNLNIIKLFFNQFKNILIIILIIIALISFFFSDSKIDFWIILSIIILNAIFGFFQEYKAEKSIQKLKTLTPQKTKVLRDNKEIIIQSKYLVPGDIILLKQGDKIPADARIIKANNLEVNESILTGESIPTLKNEKIINKKIEITNRLNMLYSGTFVTKGNCTAIITATSYYTEIGKISNLLINEKKEKTPLEKRISNLAEFIGIFVLILCGFLFMINTLKNYPLFDSLMLSLSLAVAAIPEGLPAIMTICLALGVQRMAKKNAIVKKLISVETLGSTNIICTDKTGTLTYNEMTAREIFTNNKTIHITGHGYEIEGNFLDENNNKINKNTINELIKCSILCNNSKLIINKNKKCAIVKEDPTESALLIMAKKINIEKTELENNFPRIKEYPFDNTTKIMSTINNYNDKNILYTKGAPEYLLKKCSKIYIDGKIKKLTDKEKLNILNQNSLMAKKAMRVLAFSFKELNKNNINDKNQNDLIFLGLIGMIDPPRKEVFESIKKCKTAGIKIIMITGDNKETAIAIAKELGISTNAITGEELDKIQNLDSTVELIDIYARVTPEHKLRIIKALKKQGHVVAMVGDGVNDAPALKTSNIGVAMGITGSDVSKESADIILKDDNFNTIVNAIEEGRNIYNNIKKFIKYILSSNTGEVLTIIIGSLIGFYSIINNEPIPILLAIHLLWINLITDSFLALSLAVEPKNENIMNEKPIKKNDNIIKKGTIFDIILISTIMALITIYIFNISLEISIIYAQTMALTTLIMLQIFNTFNCKTKNNSILTKIFSNKWILISGLFCILSQIIIIYSPLNVLFKVTPILFNDWILIMGFSLIIIVIMEIRKLITRKYLTNSNIEFL
jgi:P-type Ca2+ transporter type 2C